jgi:quinol monooxygenase YgiN
MNRPAIWKGSTSLIVLTARIESNVPERRELGQALLAWATAARSEAGTIVAHVYEDFEAPAAFCLVAQWESQHAIEAHIRGTEFGAVLGALELLARPAQLSITQLGEMNGSDAWRTIRRLRDSGRGVGLPGMATGTGGSVEQD